MTDAEVRERIGHVETLLERVAGDPRAEDALRAVVELYGEALRRLLAGADPATDELVAHLLLVHDLHPHVRYPEHRGPVRPEKVLQVGTLR